MVQRGGKGGGDNGPYPSPWEEGRRGHLSLIFSIKFFVMLAAGGEMLPDYTKYTKFPEIPKFALNIDS